jgi:hypothetical protein
MNSPAEGIIHMLLKTLAIVKESLWGFIKRAWIPACALPDSQGDLFNSNYS